MTHRIYRQESVPRNHEWRITTNSSFIISACSHHCDFRHHSFCNALAGELASKWSVWVLPIVTHDHVRARGVATLVFFSLEDPALFLASASRVIANGLFSASIPLVSELSMHTYLNVTDRRSHRACSSVSLTESLQNPCTCKVKRLDS